MITLNSLVGDPVIHVPAYQFSDDDSDDRGSIGTRDRKSRKLISKWLGFTNYDDVTNRNLEHGGCLRKTTLVTLIPIPKPNIAPCRSSEVKV
jgi:hypothetical protein